MLFICGNRNHTTTMHAIARELPECERWFTPYYCDDGSVLDLLRRARLLEFVALGHDFRRRCLAYLREHGLAIDLGGARGGYDLVVTCSDLIVPSNIAVIDPDTIDRVIGAFIREPCADYVSNLHPPSWPDGFDVEVMTRGALETAWREARRPLDREHTTPFLWDDPERFVVHNVAWQTGLDYSRSHRLTLDYPEDYAVIRAIYDELWSGDRPFSLAEILAVLDARPALVAANAMHRGTSWYRNHPGELRTLARSATAPTSPGATRSRRCAPSCSAASARSAC